jgi:hypothetical protein
MEGKGLKENSLKAGFIPLSQGFTCTESPRTRAYFSPSSARNIALASPGTKIGALMM